MAVHADLRPIETVPRDGSVVIVFAEDVGSFAMRWNAAGFNPLVSVNPGLWESEDRSFTWIEEFGHGPTHWRPA